MGTGRVLRDRDLTTKPWIFYGPLRGVLKDGIFTNNGSTWEAHRTAITPAFHRQVLESYTEILKEESLKITNDISNFIGIDLDCREIMTRCTSIISVRTMFSSTIHKEDQTDVDVSASVQ
ncbi:Cytochrome P450 4g15 [Frankliniella fusca]|uniref:Cytochrome P450 4g15 n=1 Tax=Frankliniella fusca TaxID=407009 RepID=A0AAE1LHY0_9NEOP|nr:Cytochrome P450 4g15 [Frankliniella fusca]